MPSSSAKILVLMYHRIDEPDTDPWSICVSPAHFEEQIRCLKKHLPIVTAQDVVKQVATNCIEENSVCVTFDDGYADNFTHALPVLSKHNCSATFFIATAFTGTVKPYWWDELEMICLHAKELPAVLQIVIQNKVCSFYFETELTEEIWQTHTHWKCYEEPPTKRCEAFLALWTLFRPLPFSQIGQLMFEVRSWANKECKQRLPMDKTQLYQLSRYKLATIGLHTHTHIDLIDKPISTQAEEILEGKKVLAGEYSIQSNLLAYPYGRYDTGTFSAIEKLKIKGCFTTNASPVTNASHVAALGRYQVFDWDYEEFESQLTNWMS